MKLFIYILACSLCFCRCQNFGDFMAEIRQSKLRDIEAEQFESETGVIRALKHVYTEFRLTDNNENLVSVSELENIPYEVGSACLNHVKMFINATIRGENWAQRMIDAVGKPPSDLLDIQVRWLGSYDECIAVKAEVDGDNQFNGKYCLTNFPLGGAQPSGLSLAIGMCFPDSCSSADASALAYTLASSLPLNTTISYPYVQCQEKDLEYSDKAVAVIVVCSVFLGLIVIATIYDVVITFLLPYMSQKQRGESSGCNNERFHSKHLNGHLYTPNDDVRSDDVISEKTSLIRDINEHTVTTARYRDKESDVTYKPELPGKLLLSFSAYTNASKILNTNQASGILTSVNGIRFISMTWVVLGHTYAFGVGVIDNLYTYLPSILKRFSFQVISNATVAVDTFFVLSGLLVAYLTLKEMKKRNGAKKFNWGMFYFHRFWRLTPPYMLVLLFYVPTIRYWTTGPLWPQSTGFEVDECKHSWWKNILYINNIVDPQNMCMTWSWYLANDMQFYIISPLMLVPLYYSKLWGSVTCFLFLLTNLITTGVISKHNNLGSNMIFGGAENDAFSLIYVKPWCRIAPYVVGIYTGYILYITDCKVKMSKAVNMLGWALAAAAALLVLYGLYDSDGTEKLSVNVAALYNSTGRTAWGMAVAWVIFACATGYGGPVNALLSWRAVIPLSRLTYCAYLVHPVVMYTYFYSRRTLMHGNDFEMSYLFMGNLCLTYAIAFIISLAFESPMMGLEKVLLGRGKNS